MEAKLTQRAYTTRTAMNIAGYTSDGGMFGRLRALGFKVDLYRRDLNRSGTGPGERMVPASHLQYLIDTKGQQITPAMRREATRIATDELNGVQREHKYQGHVRTPEMRAFINGDRPGKDDFTKLAEVTFGKANVAATEYTKKPYLDKEFYTTEEAAEILGYQNQQAMAHRLSAIGYKDVDGKRAYRRITRKQLEVLASIPRGTYIQPQHIERMRAATLAYFQDKAQEKANELDMKPSKPVLPVLRPQPMEERIAQAPKGLPDILPLPHGLTKEQLRKAGMFLIKMTYEYPEADKHQAVALWLIEEAGR